MKPEQSIDEAEGMPFGVERRQVLLDALANSTRYSPDDIARRAVILAMLAQQDKNCLSGAVSALREAAENDVPVEWARIQLAEAWCVAGDLAAALECATSVDREFFDSQDLRWRSVRMDEIRAVALLGLGRYAQGIAAASAICEEIERTGDDDDLAPPIDLGRAALRLACSGDSDAGEAGCTVLRAMVAAMDLDSWFSPELTNEVRHTLSNCSTVPRQPG